MGEDESGSWPERRRRAIAAHAAADQRRREVETARARELIAEFARQARDRDLRQTRLTVLAHNGRSRYRTALTGWYLDVARIHAVDNTGAFYLLTMPTSLRARLVGAAPRPQPPKMIIGEGGRDGQSIPLRTLLRNRLDAGDDWP